MCRQREEQFEHQPIDTLNVPTSCHVVLNGISNYEQPISNSSASALRIMQRQLLLQFEKCFNCKCFSDKTLEKLITGLVTQVRPLLAISNDDFFILILFATGEQLPLAASTCSSLLRRLSLRQRCSRIPSTRNLW